MKKCCYRLTAWSGRVHYLLTWSRKAAKRQWNQAWPEDPVFAIEPPSRWQKPHPWMGGD